MPVAMGRGMKRSAAPLLVAMLAGVASADPPHAAQAKVLSEYTHATDQIRTRAAEFPSTTYPEAAPCHDAIAAATRNGARPEDRLYAPEFAWRKPDGWAKDATGAYVQVKDALKICATYDALKRGIPTAITLLKSARSLESLGKVTPEIVGDTYGAQSIAAAEACIAAVDKALASGLPAELTYVLDRKEVALGRARVEICEAYLAAARPFAAASTAAKRAAHDKRAAPYRALGVKGERLKLFVDYDDTPFYAAGCRAEILDAKVLARATVLFHWLENSDGTHTIRKYVIKGDTYRTMETTYETQARAYAGCR
jgi:hypothetical protein